MGQNLNFAAAVAAEALDRGGQREFIIKRKRRAGAGLCYCDFQLRLFGRHIIQRFFQINPSPAENIIPARSAQVVGVVLQYRLDLLRLK